jgi:hypothetical protein
MSQGGQSGMNFKNMKMPTVSSGMIGGGVFFVIILIAIYYLYIFLYTSATVQASLNIIPSRVLDTTKLKNGGVIRCDAAKASTIGSDLAVAEFANATGLTSGGQYTVTMWLSVYSTSPQTAGSATIPLLDITATGKNTLLFIGLMPTNGTLVVNQGTGDAMDGTVGPFGMSPTPATGTSPYTSSDKCNIVNGIEYQRWILIGVVASGTTLDVYIDGKLSRSCVYKGMNSLGAGVTDGKATITVGRQSSAKNTGTLNGVFSTTEYYNYALTPDIMWSIYQNGPATASSAGMFSSLFDTNIDLSMGTANN